MPKKQWKQNIENVDGKQQNTLKSRIEINRDRDDEEQM